MKSKIVGLLAFAVPIVAGAGPGKIAEIKAPEGYSRVKSKEGSFSSFVRSLSLKKDGKILTWDGRENDFQGFDVLGVVDMPLLYKQYLEQCADWAMRFWAEHHKAAGILNRLALFNYDGSRKRYRGSGKSFREFLRLRMAYSNSHSLKKGTKTIKESDLKPGDLIVQNETGGIGHVSVIMDAAEADGKPRVYLIGFSFMPAQEFHVERASHGQGAAGWFTLEGFQRFLKERLDLGAPVLRRFPGVMIERKSRLLYSDQ